VIEAVVDRRHEIGSQENETTGWRQLLSQYTAVFPQSVNWRPSSPAETAHPGVRK
jgi:hypothetical protein